MYKLGQKFRDTEQPICIFRLSDNASIPLDINNADYQAYLKWLDGYELQESNLVKVSEKNTPLPADE